MAEVTDDSCTVQFIEIVPLDRASDDCRPFEFIDPATEVKLEDLDVKQEPADENDSEVQCVSVRVMYTIRALMFLSAIRYPIGSPIIVMIWSVVFANKSRKLGWIWMKLGRLG